ncbi:SipW-dependent-type signal peptide-containing protein [Halomarina pelagica]|uniref:SipW-dependent-type signal peptide-containing protein n=1 Tax=Halomarina pelagica TaxID=2961599 RepID=UPI0020C3ECCC|nr:SipW-dependent-type signal peptide-containing protein [Halomarina sp. BND7]
MSDKPIRLSRRKMLAGLGTIGVASTVAGLGSYAAFSDDAQAKATFTAGDLDGTVRWSASYNGEIVDQSQGDEGDHNDLADGHPVRIQARPEEGLVGLSVQDLKPGDFGSIVFELSVETNPAWVTSCIGYENDDDNGINNPESYSDDPQARPGHVTDDRGEGEGELADALLVLPFYDADVRSSFFDGDNPGVYRVDAGRYECNPEYVRDYADGTTAEFWDNAEECTFLPQTVAEVAKHPLKGGTVLWNYPGATQFIAKVLGVPYDGEYGRGCTLLNGAQRGNTDNTQVPEDLVQPLMPVVDSAGEEHPENVVRFGYDWHLPYTVGNEVQTDQLDVLFGFHFQQYRHNRNPLAPSMFTPGTGASSGEHEGDDLE